MLQTLIESRGTRVHGRGQWTLVSAAVHATIITAAVVATMSNGRRSASREEFSAPIYVVPSQQPHVHATSRPSGSIFTEPIDVDVPTIHVPGRIDFSPTRIDPSIGAEIGGTLPGAPSASGAPDGVFTDLTVDRIVAPRPGNPQPVYPSVLRSSGLAGTVVARFIVDTSGVVERGSVAILEATHAAFADAVRAWLPLTRYYPAEAGGHRVRQLVQQRVEFQLR